RHRAKTSSSFAAEDPSSPVAGDAPCDCPPGASAKAWRSGVDELAAALGAKGQCRIGACEPCSASWRKKPITGVMPLPQVPSNKGASVAGNTNSPRSEEHTSELQSRFDLVCRLLLDNKRIQTTWYCLVPR